MNHEQNRIKVCAPCGEKIVFGKQRPNQFLISDKIAGFIKKYCNNNFSKLDPIFPAAICTSCRHALFDREKGNFKRPLVRMPNYEDIVLIKPTRSHDDICNCFICITGRFKGHKKTSNGRGHLRNSSTVIDKSNGLYGASKTAELSTPKKNMDESRKSVEICNLCFQKVGKGLSHSCGSHARARENLLKLVNQLPEKQKEQIATDIIKQKLETHLNDITNSSSDHSSNEIALSTTGLKTRVTVNSKEPNHEGVTEEKLDNFRANTCMSKKESKRLYNFVRSSFGRKSIPAYYNQHMSRKSKTLENVYKEGIYEFETPKGETKEKRSVVWADAEELLQVVLEQRNQTGNVYIKVMADGGQGFFKICLSILPEDYFTSPEYNSDDPEINSDSPAKKRNLYSQGGTTAKKGKFTSVKRLIMLCIVPDIKETYENIRLLFDLTKINNIPFKFVSDFKVLLIVNGQQTASAMYPCPYCFVTLTDLQTPQVVIDQENCTENSNASSLATSERCLRLKTYGDLRRDYETFSEMGKAKKHAKNCHSTVNPPLFSEDDETYVIEKCIIPELHVLQGFVNHLFWKGLVPLVGEEKALLWPKKVGSASYHGGIFEGNACRELLKNADKLNDPAIAGSAGPLELVPFISAFKAMNKVVNCCFSTRKVGPDLDKYLLELRKALESTQISESLKIHVLMEHVKHCLHFLDGEGFGVWSEQAGESIHSEF